MGSSDKIEAALQATVDDAASKAIKAKDALRLAKIRHEKAERHSVAASKALGYYKETQR